MKASFYQCSLQAKNAVSPELGEIMKHNRIICSSVIMAMFCLLVSRNAANAQGPAPVMAQVPFVSATAGNASGALVSPCTSTTNLMTTGGKSYGDGCPATEAIVSTPYGASVDGQGNVYFADEGNTYVRVVYNGGATAAAMINAANASHAGLVPTAGYIYALAGGLTGSITATNTDGKLACGNVAGNGDALNSSGDNCPATEAYINTPYGATVDAAGDVFIVDRGGSKIHVVYAGGALAASLITLENPTITTPQIGYLYLIAGGSSGYADAVLGTSGKLKSPGGLVVDSNENLYIADTGNNAIREVLASTGFIHTIGGNCTSSACSALAAAPATNVVAVGAGFLAPQGIAVDSSGNVYVADDSSTQGNGSSVYPEVRLIYAGGSNNPAASLICMEGGSSGYGTFSGTCSASTLTAGRVYAIAGKQTSASASSGNGLLAAAAQFEKLTALAVDPNGNIYVADYASPSIIAEVNANTGYLTFLASDGQAVNGAVSLNSYCAPGAASGLQPTDIYGDGCPGPQSYSHHIEGNMGADLAGDIYYADSGDNLVRSLKYSNAIPATTVGTSATYVYAYTLLPPTTSLTLGTPSIVTQGIVSSVFADAGTGDSCSNGVVLYGTANATNNTTCLLYITFTPAKVGVSSAAVTINSGTGAVVSNFISGIGIGAELVIDPATAASIGAGTIPQGVTTDVSGNTYITFAGQGTVTSTAGALAATAGAGLSQPYQVAVDGAGNVYVADSGNNRIAEFAAGTSTGTTLLNGLSGPKGVAVDSAGNRYIADTGNARVLMLPNGSGQLRQLGSGFATPVAVAVDAADNVYVADSGLGAIIKIAPGTGVQTTLISGIAPVGLSVDAAGDVYYVDSSLKEVVEIPVNGANSIPVTGLTSPIGVALDTNSNLYVADTANTHVSFYNRASSTQSFASISTILSATLTNAGNANYVETGGSFTQTDSTDFKLTSSNSNGCNFASSISAGFNCGLTAQFTPTANGPLSDTATFAGNALNAGTVTLKLTGTGSITVATTTTLGSVTPVSPVYGQSVNITATVSPNTGSSTPTGNITFTVDGVAQSAVTLSGGQYVLTLSSLSAGPHTVSATYAGGGNFSGSSTVSATTINVGTLAITATATSLTSTYGQAIPMLAGSLNGVLPADQSTVLPVFATTATSNSAVGIYPITVSLTGSSASNYTVTINGSPTVTVQQATVTLTISNATKVYGSANPSFSGTLTGVLSSDQANVAAVFSTTATTNSPVMTYVITATGLSGSSAGNYKLGTITPGTLTVTALGITTTATSTTTIYGQAIPVLSGSALNGVLSQDVGNVSAIFSTTATPTSPVGNYPISVALTGSASGNYTVSLTVASFVTIQPATVTVVVNNATRAYGAANPAFSGTLTGVLSADASNVLATYVTSANATSSVGNYSITVTGFSGSAAGNYKLGTVTPGSLIVNQAATTTTLTESAPAVSEGNSASFTAVVASTTSGTPTGSVTFYNGTTALGTATLSNGMATYANSNLPYGTQTISAVYSGNSNFITSTSSSVTETITIPIVSGTASASSITISSGGTGALTVTFNAQGGYIGTATYSCANLPADMTCSFAPPTSTFTSTSTSATTTLTISTAATAAFLQAPDLPQNVSPHGSPLLALCVPGFLVGFLGLLKGKKLSGLQRGLSLLVFLVAGLVGMVGLSGCGGNSPVAKTPPGTYNTDIIVTAGTQQMIPLTVIVQ